MTTSLLPAGEDLRYARGEGWESVTRQQVIALISSTRCERVAVDHGVLCAGAATTTVYPCTIAPDVAYVVSNS